MRAVLQDASSRAANAQEPSLLWHLHGECGKLAAVGDWDGANVLNWAIMALVKGTGKGKGTAKEDIGAKEASPKSAGKGGDGFDGNCHHCGAYCDRKAMQTPGCGTVCKKAKATKANARRRVRVCTLLEPMRRTLRTTKKNRSPSIRAKEQLTMRGGLVR